MIWPKWQGTAQIGSWEFGMALDVFQWAFGIYYENAVRELDVLVGPLSVWCCHETDTGRYWPSGSLVLLRWGRRKLRLDWSTHQFILGYSRSGYRDHGLYIGPIDLQIDYVRRNADAVARLIREADLRLAGHAPELSGRMNDVLAHWKGRHATWFEQCRIDLDLSGNDDGWADLVNDTFQAIEAELAGHRKLELRLTQIKEKFGSLRIYFRFSVATDADKNIAALINQAHAQSRITCHLCGRPGSAGAEKGHIEVRCRACETQDWKPI